MQEFDDINAFKRNFYEKYHKVLVPAIKNFENERKIKLFLGSLPDNYSRNRRNCIFYFYNHFQN